MRMRIKTPASIGSALLASAIAFAGLALGSPGTAESRRRAEQVQAADIDDIGAEYLEEEHEDCATVVVIEPGTWIEYDEQGEGVAVQQ